MIIYSNIINEMFIYYLYLINIFNYKVFIDVSKIINN